MTQPGPAVTRRRALTAVGAGSLAALAGCLDAFGSEEDAPDPVDLSGGKFDYQGGMEIGPHGGPNGQIFYEDEEPDTSHDPGDSPEARDDLAWFHTLVQGLFPYHFDRLDQGWEPAVVYVTDYSSFDWELFEQDGHEHMPSPTDAETFGDATELTYVAESDVMGGMGPELFPFSEESEAEAFIDDHGGQTLEFDDIDRDLVQMLQDDHSHSLGIPDDI